MRFPPFTRLLVLLFAYGSFGAMHWSLSVLFLKSIGFDVAFILTAIGILYATAAVAVGTLSGIGHLTAMRIGIVCRVLTVVPYAFFPTEAGIILASILMGFGTSWFWVPFNVLYYTHRRPDNKATLSAWAFVLMPIIDILMTLLGGLLVRLYGFQGLFIAAIGLGLLPLLYSALLRPPRVLPAPLPGPRESMRGMRTLIFIDGLEQGVVWPATALVTLFFITGVFGYAAFFAGLGAAGALGAIVLARWSDRGTKKLRFVRPFLVVSSLASFVSMFAGTLLVWGLSRGVAGFANTMDKPFRNAIYLDKSRSVEGLYTHRETLLNIGRVIGVGLLGVFAWYGNIQYGLVIPAMTGILYLVVVEAKELYPEEVFLLKPMRGILRQG